MPGRRDTSRDSVFFTVMPPPLVARDLHMYAADQSERLGLTGTPLFARVLHVSLVELGLYDALSPDRIAWAKQMAGRIERLRFVAGFDRLLSFRRNRGYPLVLCGGDGVVGLVALHEALQVALGRKPRPGFTPHMTLLYDEQRVPEILLEEPVKFPVSDFMLVRSLSGRSDYRVLGRWPLRGSNRFPAHVPMRPTIG